ncbi:ankyrin repeat domain-containing protein [Flaviaesturariibacter terrae]
MFLPKSLIELEALLPAPLPPALRRFLARRPQANAFADWNAYPRAAVLERYRERLARGEDPQWLPFGRSASGDELLVHSISTQVVRATGEELTSVHDNFTDWIAAQRASLRSANTQPLLRAARAGDGQRITRLLRRGANINGTDARGNSALMLALLTWNYEAAQLLLDNGADISLRDRDGHCALHWACYRNQPQLVARLLQLGADPNARSNDGAPPLYFALTGPYALTQQRAPGSLPVVQLLLQHGADPHVVWQGRTLLEWARPEADPGIIRWLLQQG